MSTSSKTPASIRQGGPGASHENAKKPSEATQPVDPGNRHHTHPKDATKHPPKGDKAH